METGTSSSRSSLPATVEEIFEDHRARRLGLIRALTIDKDEDLCLFGYPNESWGVAKPSEKVPAAIPEPSTGINFARDSMDRTDWLYMVAVHSYSWLMAVAFYHGAFAGLNAVERNRLFTRINSLPDVYEVVRDSQPAKDKPRKQSGESSGRKSRSGVKRSSDGNSKKKVEESHTDDEEQEETHCGSCGLINNGDEFWIACDVCELWYHGKCVEVTPAMAKTIDKYRCPYCDKKRARP
ncbi:hypothetical protein SSX86_013054 [Deinandra increscens subsp. villosa]|uniref:PHD finger protein ALFIN-LIKE n=1 Tax=Deinandra increscens subsp. villosa TaxID=3103831 RepID=A0AAP0GZD9_9ASTR